LGHDLPALPDNISTGGHLPTDRYILKEFFTGRTGEPEEKQVFRASYANAQAFLCRLDTSIIKRLHPVLPVNASPFVNSPMALLKGK
jgi:hypothetical protein